MRLSCLSAMLGDGPIADTFAAVADAGFDGIDIRGDFAAEHIDEIGKLTSRTGLPVATIYGRVTIPLLSSTHAERGRSMELVRSRLRTAAAVGAENVIVVPVFGPAQLTVDLGKGVEDAEIAVLFALLTELAEDASAEGVRILLEPLNRGETHLLTSPTQTAALTRRFGSPWVKTMIDTYHTDLEGQDPVAELEAGGDQIGLIHLSDRSRKLPGDGGIDFAPLLAAGFGGWMGLECGSVYDVAQLAGCVNWLRSQASAAGVDARITD